MGRPVGFAKRTMMFLSRRITSVCGFTRPGLRQGPETAACETDWIPASAGMTWRNKRLPEGHAEAW